MASSIPLFNKVVNSFLFRKVQNDPIVQSISSLFKKRQVKNIATESQATTPKSRQETSHASPKSVAKTFMTAGDMKPTHIIDNRFLDNFQKDKNTEIYIIYLNRPFDIEVLCNLHKISSYTMMADGAANRFHDRYTGIGLRREIIPHALIGDFDSIRDDVIQYYRSKNVQIYHDRSQDDTDLEKCLRHLQSKFLAENRYDKNKFYRIIITGSLGGRLDHTLNNIHILHKFSERYINHENVSLHLMDNNSIGTCILPGKTKYIRSKEFELSQGCGIFPLLGEAAQVKTKGLKWNIGEESPMSFEKFVSSSNEMLDDEIEIETNKTIFWTTSNKIHEKFGKDY